jgi:hypothetical protein
MKRISFFILFFLICVPFCFAAMTIYFKDGSSKEVYKITFKGQTADLYLMDGSLITVPVEKIDLRTSGIGAPVGTYGQTRVAPGRPQIIPHRAPIADSLRQVHLKEEWERTDRSATALNNVGAIRLGDTVKIVGETDVGSRAPGSSSNYEEYDDYYYDSNTRQYYKYRNYRSSVSPQDKDFAYVVLYQNPDGSFSKRLFDAATFSENFKLDQQQSATKAPPVVPGPYPTKTTELPAPQVNDARPAQQQRPETVTPQSKKPAVTESKPEQQEKKESAPGERKKSAKVLFIASLALLIGLLVYVLMKRKGTPLVDTSNFHKYEEDLREFEIGIWLRNGKTMDQLMEICLKKFYQDNPAALTISMRMLKGDHQMNFMIPFIMKQLSASSPEAEYLYVEFQSQIERIRSLIKEVSQRTGTYPRVASQPDAVTVTQPSKTNLVSSAVETPPTVVAQPAVDPVSSGTSSVVNRASLIEPDEPLRRAADMPAYANNLLSQIGFLSSPDDK